MSNHSNRKINFNLNFNPNFNTLNAPIKGIEVEIVFDI